MARVLVFATEAEAQRAIDAIDSLRPETETVDIRQDGRVIRTEERPRKTWAVPVELEGGGWGVPFPARKINPAWEGRIVDVRGTPTRIGTRAETVEREIRERATAEVLGPGGRIR